MQGYRLTRCRCDDHPRLRKLALEFLIVLAEKAGSMARRCKLLVEQAVPLALTLMCTIEDDPEWNDKVRAHAGKPTGAQQPTVPCHQCTLTAALHA